LLCQYFTLLLDLAPPPAQAHQLFALGCRQPFLATQWLAAITPVLRAVG
jgi:hypothetical protein